MHTCKQCGKTSSDEEVIKRLEDRMRELNLAWAKSWRSSLYLDLLELVRKCHKEIEQIEQDALEIDTAAYRRSLKKLLACGKEISDEDH